MNIYNVIKKNNENNGQKIVMTIKKDNGEKESYTYLQLFENVSHVVNKLKCIGIKAGDRLIIAAENSPEWNIAFLAIMAIKATAVLIDAALPKEEIETLIDQSDARCVFMSPKVREKFDGIVSQTIPVLNILDRSSPFEGHLSQVATTMEETLDGDESIALIIYSSGTTRRAAGIMHTHEAMIGTTEAAIKFNHLDYNERMLVIIPNSHIYGVVTSMLGPLMLGASMYFIESLLPQNILAAFSEYQPTIFSCVPRVFEAFKQQIVDKINKKTLTAKVFQLFFPICLKVRKTTGINLGKIIFKSIHKGFGGHSKIFCAAGAPLDADTAGFYYGTGFNLFLNYGLTETNVPIIANCFENYTIHSCGKPYPHVEIKLKAVDESNNTEIYVKTPYMMKGYFRDEAATAEAYEEGWFKTGDMGSKDEKGNISIVGRCKDNIVLSTGKKVTPDHIENGYGSMEGIKEFIVCGIPVGEGSHDEAHAFVVKDEHSKLTKEEIIEIIYKKGSELSLYMKIAKIHFVEEIKKTSLQKPKRFLLKQEILEARKNKEKSLETLKIPVDPERYEDEVSLLIRMIEGMKKTSTKIHVNTRIFEDLGFDSLDAIELSAKIEESTKKNLYGALKPGVTISELVIFLKKAKDKSQEENKDISMYPRDKGLLEYGLFCFYNSLVKLFYKVELKGLENLPKEGGYIVCPNHVTNFDYLWVTIGFNRERFNKMCCMAKKELFNDSLSSKLLCRTAGMIPVDRQGSNKQVIEKCKEKLNEGWGVLIYPEGTRSKDGKLGEFKKGAASLGVETGVPLIPVKIKGGYDIYPAGSKFPKLFDFKNMRRCKVEVIFGEGLLAAQKNIEVVNNELRQKVVNL